MELPYPDEPLTGIQYSLSDFVQRARRMYHAMLNEVGSLDDKVLEDSRHAFVRFVLAGRVHDDNGQHRVLLNASESAFARNHADLEILREYNWAIGFSRTLPFSVAMEFHLIPWFHDMLTKDVHLDCPPSWSKRDKKIHLHDIPNMEIGKIDTRQVTRVFFPRLIEDGKTPVIPPDVLHTIYDKCLRPAAVKVNPMDSCTWPVTLLHAISLCGDDSGRFHHGFIVFPPELLDDFAKEFLRLLDMHEQLKDAFFVFELRETKGSCRHTPENSDEQRYAREMLFRNFRPSSIVEEDWLVNVALEFRHKDHVLQWRTHSHRHLLHYLLPGADEEKIDAVIKSPNQYHLDLQSQLADLGGFRSTPASRGKADSILYASASTTDKAVTDQLHQGVYRHRKAWDLFPKEIDCLVRDCHIIADTFRQCGGSSPVGGLEANARLEIWVPLSQEQGKLKEFPSALAQNSLISLDMNLFWFYKFYRMTALSLVIEKLANTESSARQEPDSLTLGAIAIYMLNATIYRPDEGRLEALLTEAACQHVCTSRKPELEQALLYTCGTYFVSDIASRDGPSGATYYLPKRALERQALLKLYCRDPGSFVAEFLPSPDRPRERTDRRLRNDEYGDLEDSESIVSDEDTEDSESTAESDGEDNPNISLALIKQHFLADIVEESPIPNKARHKILVNQKVGPANLDIFCSLDLSDVFDRVQCRVSTPVQWKCGFNHYFPPKYYIVPDDTQHYDSCKYWNIWRQLTERSTEEEVAGYKEQIGVWFDSLSWLPSPEGNRIWCTKMIGNGWLMVPEGDKNQVPGIMIHPRFANTSSVVTVSNGSRVV